MLGKAGLSYNLTIVIVIENLPFVPIRLWPNSKTSSFHLFLISCKMVTRIWAVEGDH